MRAIGAISLVLWFLGGLAGAAGAEPAPGADVRLNLELREAPLGEVTTHLTEKLGVSFELEPGVNPRTLLTGTLLGVTLEQALRVLLEPAGLTYECADGVYTIRLAPRDARPDATPDRYTPIAPSVSTPPQVVSPAGPATPTEEAGTRIVVVPLKYLDSAQIAVAFGGAVFGEGPLGGGRGALNLPIGQLGQRSPNSSGVSGYSDGQWGGGWGRRPGSAGGREGGFGRSPQYGQYGSRSGLTGGFQGGFGPQGY